MGMCVSYEPKSKSTAKVIHQDGRLEEFTYNVKVSYVLSKHPTSFLCNSDDMEFDDAIFAVGDDEELQPGQLYFALPLTKLRRPLPAVEMAALAVKANAALLKYGGGPTEFFFDGGDEPVQIRRSRSEERNYTKDGNEIKRYFTANLSIIEEEK